MQSDFSAQLKNSIRFDPSKIHENIKESFQQIQSVYASEKKLTLD